MAFPTQDQHVSVKCLPNFVKINFMLALNKMNTSNKRFSENFRDVNFFSMTFSLFQKKEEDAEAKSETEDKDDAADEDKEDAAEDKKDDDDDDKAPCKLISLAQ